MSDVPPHLGLPLLAASQAQKHVTHNEALGLLDALVQLACLDKDLTAPPSSPAEGDRYLVVASNPGGAWAGLAGQVVRYADGVWTGTVPRAGFFAYVVDEADLYIFDGAAWTSFRRRLTAIQSVSRLGINTDADATNRLAVRADAALLSWDDVTPGSGDMRVTVNKKAAARDAGFVFQTGWSSRALFGTLGSDDFTLKTSPDGTAFVTALTAAAATGVVAFAKSPTAPTPAAGDASTQLATTAFVAARGLAFRNRLINGAFAINQRGISGTVAAPAGSYAHDRWKAGANGAAYTFAAAANGDVTLTGAGSGANTLLQILEGNLYLPEGGAYVLSWIGTATARIYQGNASGGYASGTQIAVGGQTVNALAVTGLTAGTNAVVEFNLAGGLTLGLVQFEPGTTPTPFERRDDEVRRCLRYYRRVLSANEFIPALGAGAGVAYVLLSTIDAPMRAPPALDVSATADFAVVQAGGATSQATSISATLVVAPTVTATRLDVFVASGLGAGQALSLLGLGASARLALSAEL